MPRLQGFAGHYPPTSFPTTERYQAAFVDSSEDGTPGFAGHVSYLLQGVGVTGNSRLLAAGHNPPLLPRQPPLDGCGIHASEADHCADIKAFMKEPQRSLAENGIM